MEQEVKLRCEIGGDKEERARCEMGREESFECPGQYPARRDVNGGGHTDISNGQAIE